MPVIEPWELILHHTYAGTPGVVFDHSPGRSSHGMAAGLDPSDFVLDGYANGSGAVRFHGRGMVRVDPTGGWDRLGAFRAEIVFRLNPGDLGGHFLNARPLSFYAQASDRNVDFGFKTTDHAPGSFLGWQDFDVDFADVGVDPHEWTTVAIMHDGFGTAQILINGEIAKTWLDKPLQPVRPVTTVTIGNEPGGSLPFRGLIDDVKIWRPNPVKVKSDFTNRIIKDGVTDCWVQWGRKFRHALDAVAPRDSECLGRLNQLVDDLLTSTIAPALTQSSSTRQALQDAIIEYRRLWLGGNIAEIRSVLSGLERTLASEGIDIEQMTAYQALISDGCFQELMQITPPLDCDPQFVKMFKGGGI
jgi:Concanavalin A-like lectin/glucanases superfamily